MRMRSSSGASFDRPAHDPGRPGQDQRGPEATARGSARRPGDGGWLIREPSGFFEERADIAEFDRGRPHAGAEVRRAP
jgi:hypothetical protein